MTKTIQRARRSYQVDYLGHTWTLEADRLGNARVAGLLRAARTWGMTITVSPASRVHLVRACAWCRARPCAWKWFGQTRRELATCDSEQCRAARRATRRGEIGPPSYLIAARPLTAILHPPPAVRPPRPPQRPHEEVTGMFSPLLSASTGTSPSSQ